MPTPQEIIAQAQAQKPVVVPKYQSPASKVIETNNGISIPPPTPFLAKGVDEAGNPFYGRGIQGYARKIVGSIFDPNKMQGRDRNLEMSAAGLQQTANAINDLSKWDSWGEKIFGISAKDIGTIYTALGQTLTQKVEGGKLAEKKTGEKIGAAIALASSTEGKIAQQSFWTALDVVGVTDYLARKYYAGVQTLNELGGTGKTISFWNPVGNAYRVLRDMSNGNLSMQDFKSAWNRNQDASPVIWTMIFDKSKQEEYKRRWESGEYDSSQLNADLADWRYELAGSIVGDPMNYFGVGIVGKLDDTTKAAKVGRAAQIAEDLKRSDLAFDELRAARKVSQAELFGRDLARLGRQFELAQARVGGFIAKTTGLGIIGETPTIGELLKINVGPTRLMNEAENAAKISSELGLTPEALQAAEKSGETTSLVRKWIGDLRTGLVSPKYNLTTLIASDRAALSARTATDVIMLAVHDSNSIDDSMGLIRDLSMITSPDEKQAGYAISRLATSKMQNVMFSDEGRNAALLLGEMRPKVDEFYDLRSAYTKYKQSPERVATLFGEEAETITKDAKKYLQLFGDDDPEKIAAYWERELHRSSSDLIPSVEDMRLASVKVGEAAKAGKTIEDAKVTRLAEQYDKLKPYVKTTNEIQQFLDKAIYTRAKKFFSSVYLGGNLFAYPERNVTQSLVMIASDISPAVAGEVWTESRAMYSAKATEQVMLDYLDRLDEIGIHTEAARRGLGTGNDIGITEGISGLATAARGESIQSVIITHSVSAKMKRDLLQSKIIPSVAELETMGWSHTDATAAWQIAYQNWGNPKKTRRAIEALFSSGEIETWRYIEPSERMSSFLDGNIKARLKFEEARRAKTQVEFEEIVDSIKLDYEDSMFVNADNEMRAGVHAVSDPQLEDEQKAFLNELQAEGTQESSVASSAMDSAREMELAAKKASQGAIKRQIERALEQNNPGLLPGLDKAFRDAEDARVAGHQKITGLADYVVRTQREILSADVSEIPAIWGRVKFRDVFDLKEYYPSVDPASIPSKRDMVDMLWRAEKDVQATFWYERNSTYASNLIGPDGVLAQYAKAAGLNWDELAKSAETGQVNLIKDALEKQQIATAWSEEWRNLRLAETAPVKTVPIRKVPAGVTLAQMDMDALKKIGWTRGKAGIKNAVNEERRLAGLAEYATAEEIPFAEAQRVLRERGYISDLPNFVPTSKINPDRYAQPIRSGDYVSEIANTPYAELDESTQRALSAAYNDLYARVDAGSPGMRIKNEAGEVSALSSGYPEWYGPLKRNKSDVLAALKNLEKGTEKDSALYRALKDEAISHLFNNPEMAASYGFDVTKKFDTARFKADSQAVIDGVNTLENYSGAEAKKMLEMLKSRTDKLLEMPMPATDENYTKLVEAQTRIAAKLEELAGGSRAQGRNFIPAPIIEGRTPLASQMQYKNRQGFFDELDAYKQSIVDKWGQTELVDTRLDAKQSAALDGWINKLGENDVMANAVIGKYASLTRDFILHPYLKTTGDVALSYLFQYHYWADRTYARYIERVLYDPRIATLYMDYRRSLERAHRDAPEWWRYNIPLQLPGMETPLYFNLEATVNPLNSLTGVDFNDSAKRVDWMTSTVDDMGKWGPSLFTPIQWLMAAKMYAQGEEDAARRWAGRLFPQTQAIKAALNLEVGGTSAVEALGLNNLSGYGKYGELDPIVGLLDGGLDPYEEARVGRALATLIQNGESQEAVLDAAQARSGPIWNAAVSMAINERGAGQLASFVAGVGFKPRTQGDMTVDKFYNEYYALLSSQENMSPEDYRAEWTTLRTKYPFMDTVLLAKKSGEERDKAYAYAVLGRIAPGQMTALLEATGINTDMINLFYDNKGSFEGWTEQDKDRFMAGVADLGALLAAPDGATRAEWDAARTAYNDAQSNIEAQLGEGVWDRVSYWYDLPDDEQDAYLETHPDVQQALNLRNQIVANDPLLYKYYGGLNDLTRYYESKAYEKLRTEFGDDIADKWQRYYDLQLQDAANGTKLASAYKRAHPELKAYSARKAQLLNIARRSVVYFGSKLPDAPTPEIRADFTPQGQYQQDLLAAAQGVPQRTAEQWQSELDPTMWRLISDYWNNNEELPSIVLSQLDYDAYQYGYQSGEDVLQAILMSMQK